MTVDTAQTPELANAQLPSWWREQVRERYDTSIAHAFTLHGPGVKDYPMNFNISLRNVLETALAAWECVVFYDRAHGLSFSAQSKGTKAAFFRETGITPPTEPRKPDEGQVSAEAKAAYAKELAEKLRPFREPSAALQLMDGLLRKVNEKEKFITFVMNSIEFVVPDMPLAQMQEGARHALAMLESWGADPVILNTGNMVILTTANIQDIHPKLRAASAKYEGVEIPIPTREDRADYIRWFSAENPDSIKYGDGLTHERVADLTAGLTRVHIEDVYLKKQGRGVLTTADIRERKDDIIRAEFGDVVQILEPKFGLEGVGGYDYVKDGLLKRIINPLREGQRSRWGGVILAGPPGTGKTILAEAMAKDARVNALELRISKLLSKWVGESDKNLARALGLIDSMAPCIVFMDELDVALPNRQGGDNDSGVSGRILAALMPFMADQRRRGKVVWVGATNRIDNVDAALKRVGRFDRVIPVLAPTPDDREAILKVMLKDVEMTPALEKSIKGAVEKTTNWTGAELLMLVEKAKDVMTDEEVTLDKALTTASTLITANTQLIELLSLIATVDCNDKSLLPPSVVKAYEEQATMKRIEELQMIQRRGGNAATRRDN